MINGHRREILALALPAALFAGLGVLARFTTVAQHYPILFTICAIGLGACALSAPSLRRRSQSRLGRWFRALAGGTLGAVVVVPNEVRLILIAAVWPIAFMATIALIQLVVIARHLRAAFRQSQQSFVACLEDAIAETTNPAFARLVALELSLLHSAITQWRTDPAAIRARARFNYERSFRWLFLATSATIFLVAVDVHAMAAIHQKWEWFAVAAVADILLLYVLATWKSFRLLPVYLSDNSLVVRAGHLVSLDLDLDRIKSVSLWLDRPAGVPPEGYLSFSFVRRPNFAIHVHEAEKRPRGDGFYKVIVGRLDDPDSLVRAFRQRLAIEHGPQVGKAAE